MSVKVSKNKKQNFIIEIKNTNNNKAIVPPPKIEHQDIRSGLVLDIKFNGSWIDIYIRDVLNMHNDVEQYELDYEFAYVCGKNSHTYEHMFHEELKNGLSDITHHLFKERFYNSLENLAIEYYQKGWIISTEN